jgi:HK97 family phage prohead protease
MKINVNSYVNFKDGDISRYGKVINVNDETATVKFLKVKNNKFVLTVKSKEMLIKELDLVDELPSLKSSSKKMEYKRLAFKINETEEKQNDSGKYGIIKGYASTYNNVDYGLDVVMPGAFSKCIGRMKEENKPIKMLWMHDGKEIIGGFPVKEIQDDPNGLYVTGEINLETQRGKEAYALAKQGVLSDMSIGYFTVDSDFTEAGVRRLKEIDLFEVSLVGMPMNPKANITTVKSKDGENPVISVKELEAATSREEFNLLLRKSGAFTKSARECLTAWFAEHLSKSKQQEETDVLINLENEIKQLTEAFKNDH